MGCSDLMNRNGGKWILNTNAAFYRRKENEWLTAV